MKSDSVPIPHVRFGPFEVDFETGEVRKHGLKLKLQEKPLRVLQALLEKPGKLVTREDLRHKLWPEDHYVDFDRNLTIAMNRLRTVLNDSADEPRYIETLPRRGYRFIYPMDGKGLPGSDATPSEGVPSNRTTPGLLARHKKAVIGAAAIVLVFAGLAWFLLRRPPQPSAELKQTRLTFNSSENAVQTAAISPDGKYLAYSDPAGIHLKLISTGEERPIPRPAGVAADAWWILDSWFPDGTQVLADTVGPGAQHSMWTVSVLGQSPHELREGAGGWEVSPDGTRIAFGPAGASGSVREIWVMGSQGDNPQKVLALGENEWFNEVHWSPDGKRLAYIRVRVVFSGPKVAIETAIETCDLKGANRTVVVSEVNTSLESFCWLADGRIVYSRGEFLYSSDDNLWQIGIDGRTGAPTGKSRRVTQWAGSFLGNVCASADGKRLTFQKMTYQAQVYLGELTAGGTRLNFPRRLTNDEANDSPTAWTADSKAVLFSSDRNGAWGIFKQGISQDSAEVVVAGPQGDSLDPRLSADGAWILYREFPTGAGLSTEGPLLRIPASGGVPQLVLNTRNARKYECARAPARLCVISEVSQDEKQLTLTAFDPLQGRGKVLRTIEKDPRADYETALSPDGTTVAISKRSEADIHIRLLSLTGGSDREITAKGWENRTGLDWSSDGKGLYCGSVSPQSSTLLYLDLKGNARVLWKFKGQGYIGGVPSPDGRYLAIRGSATNSNVWMLEGF